MPSSYPEPEPIYSELVFQSPQPGPPPHQWTHPPLETLAGTGERVDSSSWGAGRGAGQQRQHSSPDTDTSTATYCGFRPDLSSDSDYFSSSTYRPGPPPYKGSRHYSM